MTDLGEAISQYYKDKAIENESLMPPSNSEVSEYLESVVIPAFFEIEEQLNKHVKSVKTYPATKSRKVRIKFKDGDMKCVFGVEIEATKRDKTIRVRHELNDCHYSGEPIHYVDLSNVSKADIHSAFLAYFESREDFLKKRETDRKYQEALYVAFDFRAPYLDDNHEMVDITDEDKAKIDVIHTRFYGNGMYSDTGVCGTCGQSILTDK